MDQLKSMRVFTADFSGPGFHPRELSVPFKVSAWRDTKIQLGLRKSWLA